MSYLINIIKVVKSEEISLIGFKVSADEALEVMAKLVRKNPVEEKEEEAVFEPKKKPGRPNKIDSRIRTCSLCGNPGHRRETCPKVAKAPEETNDNVLNITPNLIREINELLSEDKGSREIADHFGVSVKEANRGIAAAKGIKLPY